MRALGVPDYIRVISSPVPPAGKRLHVSVTCT